LGGEGTWPLLDEANRPKEVAALLDWVRAMDGKVRIMASGPILPRKGEGAHRGRRAINST